MKKQVTSEEFYKKIGPLDVMLEIKEPKYPFTCGISYPYTTLFFLKYGRKLIGYEEAGKYFLCEEDTDHE